MSKGKKWDFRDICLPLRMFRDFLLGRGHKLHGRFPPLIAPRTIPAPDVPRGPEYKYSNNFYCQRSSRDSVKPPVVAPVALGPSLPTTHAGGGGGSLSKRFDFAPTPGPSWWWDGHCYFECVPDVPPLCPEPPPPAPPCPPPCPPKATCAPPQPVCGGKP